ncbi:hypothetical protein GCM10018793_09660 [Streptomyces sulfonofaciens]|uniref:HTH lysR-type domain-containing protein n=1 Tax=Streptomyces sulfonofaciens TaxID=68272 RepID=A0A919FV79_9ACTN|nr:hypothetical protein GCM10018793_09660 [Streptomyces sulfonofaciens]
MPIHAVVPPCAPERTGRPLSGIFGLFDVVIGFPFQRAGEDLDAMRIEQLEYIEAVTRLGSLRRAAEALHLSQPALSETVRNLERELGVTILDRRRSGARISTEGRELLPHIVGVLEAVDRLRRVADEQHHTSRMIRLGTVNAATVPLLVPTIRTFRAAHPGTQVEVVGAQESVIHRELLEGGLDLGLVNYLQGDDKPPGFHTTELLRGRPVACIRSDSPLAARSRISVGDLLGEPLIVMRSGYVMHRYVHRLLEGRGPRFSYSTDGAEMGKLMVAEGLGTTVLPDFSVRGDPLERAGLITCRPLDVDDTAVLMVIQRPLSGSVPMAVRALHTMFMENAENYTRDGDRTGGPVPDSHCLPDSCGECVAAERAVQEEGIQDDREAGAVGKSSPAKEFLGGPEMRTGRGAFGSREIRTGPGIRESPGAGGAGGVGRASRGEEAAQPGTPLHPWTED